MSESILNVRGLTLIQPWCSAIVSGGKRVENRTWAPPPSLMRHGASFWLALHAGKGFDDECLDWMHTLWPNAPYVREEFPFGEILGVARVSRAVKLANLRNVEGAGPLAQHSYGGDMPLEVPDEDLGPWAFGPWCWVLEDVRRLLEPVKARGAQGLWPLERAKLCTRDEGIVYSTILAERPRDAIAP